MIAAEIIEDDARLAAITGPWADLFARLPDPLPFQSPAWLLPWRACFAPGPLLTLAAWEGDRLVGLAPGYVETGPLGRRILPLGISLSDHLDVLVDPHGEDELLATLADAALSRREAWDSWDMEELAPDAAALRMILPQGCSETLADASPCPRIALVDAEGRAYAPPRGKRRHLNLARNRAARHGAVAVEVAAPDEARATFETLLRLHASRWAGRHQPGVLASPSVQAFQREAIPALQAAGLVRLSTLAIGGQPTAALYELLGRDRSLVYLTGFDPAYEHESPSVILLAHVLERAQAEGRRSVDLGRGQEAYKYEWGATDRVNVKRTIRHDGRHGASP